MAALLLVTALSSACANSESQESISTAFLQSQDSADLQSQKDEADLRDQEKDQADLQGKKEDESDPQGQEDDSTFFISEAFRIGYEDEKKSIDLLIEAYWAVYDPNSAFQVDLSSALGTTEALYDTLNSLDPNLKNVAALSAAVEHDGTVMEKYLIGKGVGLVLADNELGQALRSNTEIIALGLLEGLISGLLTETARSYRYARSDALLPLAIGENYTLVRSLGNIYGLLTQIEKNSGYTYYTQPLKARREAVQSAIMNGAEIESCTGRLRALDEAIEEADAELAPLKKEFLMNLGFSDEDMNGEFDSPEESAIKVANFRERFRIYMNFTEEELAAYETEAAGMGDASSFREDYYFFFENFLMLHPEYGDSLVGFLEEEESQESQSQQTSETAGQKPDMSWYIYCIIDRSGKVYGSFLSPCGGGDVGATINEDGTCALTKYVGTANSIFYDDSLENAPYHVIFSREGKVLYASDTQNSVKEERCVYYDLSPNGNTLRKTYSSDFENGDRETLEFIRADGTAEEILSGKEITLKHPVDRTYTLRNDYYEYTCTAIVAGSDSTYGYIDMYTGQLLTYDEFYAKTAEDVSVPQPATGYALNDRYAISGSTIYDYEGTAVKELTAGNGVDSIRYSDGRYMVVTVSGWYYVLDEQLEYASEPLEAITKLNGQTAPSIQYQLTPYGLFVQIYEGVDFENPQSLNYYNYIDAELNYYLYDRDGQKVLLHTARNRGLIDYDILSWDDSYSYIIGNEYAGWLNLDTMEPMLLDMDGVAKALAAQ